MRCDCCCCRRSQAGDGAGVVTLNAHALFNHRNYVDGGNDSRTTTNHEDVPAIAAAFSDRRNVSVLPVSSTRSAPRPFVESKTFAEVVPILGGIYLAA